MKLKALLSIAARAAVWMVAFWLVGAALIVAGVVALLGSGWGLVTAGLFFLAAAAYLTKGLTTDG